MTGIYDEFEKRHQGSFFSAGWADVEVAPKYDINQNRKDLETLEKELSEIKDNIENIVQKQIRLANLAKFYQNGFC